jgi:hypothetical protein
MMQTATDGARRRTATALTYAGSLPFIIALLALFLEMPADDAVRVFLLDAAMLYAAVIASFVSGIHWGLYLDPVRADRAELNLFVSSNICTLAAWTALLLPMPHAPFLLLAVVFSALFVIDRSLARQGIIEDWFFALRLRISAIVVPSCLLLAFF